LPIHFEKDRRKRNTTMTHFPFPRRIALLTLFLCYLGSYARATTQVASSVTFKIELGDLSFNGGPPDVVGLVGNRSPLTATLQDSPVELLKAKNEPNAYSVTVVFPEGTQLDLTFKFVFKVDGRWRPEPFSLGIPHVAILDSNRTSQCLVLAYEGKLQRLVPQAGCDISVDSYLDASSIAQDRNEVRRYKYLNAANLLSLHKVPEAALAYEEYCTGSSGGGLEKEEYDRFYILEARILAQTGSPDGAIKLLRARPEAEGDEAYQRDIHLALARLLDDWGSRVEARSLYHEVLASPSASVQAQEEATFFLAQSYVHESNPDSLSLGRSMLQSIGRSPGSFQRKALLGLAAFYQKADATTEFKEALEEAAFVGTSGERLAIQLQILDLQFSAADYAGVHDAVSMTLSAMETGRHLPHLLALDALCLDKMGQKAESRSVLERLWDNFPLSPYAAYATSLLGRPPFNSTIPPSVAPADSLMKGGLE
jgi:hypothetical protein